MAVQVDWNAQLVIGLKKGDVKIVRTALEKGADTEHSFLTPHGYTTPLRFGIEKIDLSLVKALLENGAQIKKLRQDIRQVAESMCLQQPFNQDTKAIFELLNTTQHKRVFAAELTSGETVAQRPRVSR